jgi:hypothetical protein
VAAREADHERHAARALAAFSFLWGAAILFHVASYDEWGDSLKNFVLVAAAVCVMVRPSSVPRLMVLAVVQIYSVGVDLPYIPNHPLITSFVNLTLIGSWVLAAVRGRSFAVAPAELARTFAPIVRLEVVALYFFVVLHKLNTDYFDSDTSCGAFFWTAQEGRFDLLPASHPFQVASLWMTVGIEAAIPVLLCIRRTRSLGVLLGLIFHTVIGFNPISGFFNISAMLFAMLFLFTPEDTASRAMELWGRVRAWGAPALRRFATVSWRTAALVTATVAVGLVAVNQLDRINNHFLVVWWLYAVLMIGLLSVLLLRGGAVAPLVGGRLFGPADWRLAWIPALFVVNGLSPYLGLKTETSFSMYSNLRTEGNESNHLFIPAGSQLFGFQDELVEITASSAPHPSPLQDWADDDHLVPWYEFRARAHDVPEASVSYIRNGESHQVERIADAPEFDEQPVGRKLLFFRSIPKDGPVYCTH